LLTLFGDYAHRSKEDGMLEIAGGVLIAVAILVALVAFPTAVMFLVSGFFCLGIAAVAWYFLASQIGQAWAGVVILGGTAIWAIRAMIASFVEARAVAELKMQIRSLGGGNPER